MLNKVVLNLINNSFYKINTCQNEATLSEEHNSFFDNIAKIKVVFQHNKSNHLAFYEENLDVFIKSMDCMGITVLYGMSINEPETTSNLQLQANLNVKDFNEGKWYSKEFDKVTITEKEKFYDITFVYKSDVVSIIKTINKDFRRYDKISKKWSIHKNYLQILCQQFIAKGIPYQIIL